MMTNFFYDVILILFVVTGLQYLYDVAEERVGNLELTGLLCSNQALPCDLVIPEWDDVSEGLPLFFSEENEH